MEIKNPMAEKYQLLINGEWVDGEGGKTFKTTSPADGRFLAECAEASKADVDKAVEAAWAAFDSWKRTSIQERATILLKSSKYISNSP